MRLARQSNGKLIDFGSQSALAAGGEARIYAVPGEPDLLAKVYHQPSDERTRKLVVMLANPPTDPMAAQGHCSIAWPVDLLVTADQGRRVVGFLMSRVISMRPIIDFYHPKTRRQQCPLFSYKYLHRTARNLAAGISALHTLGYVVGDVNESNILVSQTALVTLVDTDSFQVPDLRQGSLYRCPVGKPEFTPPELQGKFFTYVDRAAEHDLFGLAVLIFQLLMEGTHPFAGVFQNVGDAPLPQQRILAGHFPYSRGRRVPYRPMPNAPPFDILSPNLQQLLVRCFEDGHRAPHSRPDARTWQAELMAAENALVQCRSNGQHWYGAHRSGCPWCERRTRLGGRDPFPPPGGIVGPPQRPLPPASQPPRRPAVAPLRGFQPARIRRAVKWGVVAMLIVLVGYWLFGSGKGTGPVATPAPVLTKEAPSGQPEVAPAEPPGKNVPAEDPGEKPSPEPPPSATPQPSSPVNPLPPPAPPPPGGVKTATNTVGMVFVQIPSGGYERGARDGEADSQEDERPRHGVNISREFWIGRYDVTQSQYEQVVGNNPSAFSASGGSSAKVQGMDTKGFPVENVSWFDCVAFANRLSEREGQYRKPYYRITNEQRSGDSITSATVEIAGGDGYRLPTEAEWEYVARAGTTTVFPGGDSLSSEQANFDGNYPYGSAKGKYVERPEPVGSYPANPWGLYDTAGNVWEWVWDWYEADEYKQFVGLLAVDPQGPAQGVNRVLRGGSWGGHGQDCRPASRYGYEPGYCFRYAGFRLALGRSN